MNVSNMAMLKVMELSSTTIRRKLVFLLKADREIKFLIGLVEILLVTANVV